MSQDRYLPALRFPALTSVYDPLIRLTTREAQFKRRPVEQASPRRTVFGTLALYRARRP